jgi:two-component system phosphate regulon sensor histidine kinase PhoR
VVLGGLTATLVIGTVARGDWLLAACSLLVGGLGLRAAIAQPGEGAETSTPRQAKREGEAELLAAGPDPIITVDRRGVVTAANAAARTLIPAVKAGEPLAFSLRAPEVLDAIRVVAATGEGQDVEYGARTASEPLVAVRLRPLPGRTGRASVALFFSDRTRERRVEAMRVDFIATVSHELRTPLASLAGFIDTIAGPARNDAAARERFLGIMRDQAGRMTRLVDDLLQLSRVELNEHLPPTDAVDLGALVAHMAEIMAPLARERGVSIRLDIAKDLPNVRGDRDQLLRVAENLIENAMKYAGRGDVVVRVRQEEGRAVALSVADQGPGIAPEHIPRLTERFYRVDEAESRARGGTGLGLAIVKHVVGRHRGRLSIESELGKGTTVRIQLPAFEAPAA